MKHDTPYKGYALAFQLKQCPQGAVVRAIDLTLEPDAEPEVACNVRPREQPRVQAQ